MDITSQEGTVTVTNVRELNSTTARAFRNGFASMISSELAAVEIDLSHLQILDGAGLGALISLYQTVNEHCKDGRVAMRLTHPLPPVLQMIELARLHHLFEVVSTEVKTTTR